MFGKEWSKVKVLLKLKEESGFGFNKFLGFDAMNEWFGFIQKVFFNIKYLYRNLPH